MDTKYKQLAKFIRSLTDDSFSNLLLVFAFTTALFVYSYEITNFSLSIDEEIHSFIAENWLEWIAQGRWGMGVLTYIFPQGFSSIPFLPTFLFAVGLALSAVLFSKILTHNRPSAIVFTGIFVTSPIWLHIAEFNTLSWGFSLGLVVTAIASIYAGIQGIKNFILAGLLLGFSLAIYQAFLILYLIVALLILCQKEWEIIGNKKFEFIAKKFPMLYHSLGIVLIGVAFYYILNCLFMFLTGANIVYLNNFIKISSYITNGSDTIIRVLHKTEGLLFGTDPTFLGIGIGSLLLAWIGSLAITIKLFDKKVGFLSKIYTIILSIGILLLAISLILLSAGYIPTRALIAFPLLYAVFSAMAFHYIKGRKILWGIFFVAIFCNIYIANSLFYADQIARQRDLVMATQIIAQVENVGRDAFGDHIPIIIVGEWRHEISGPALRVEIFGTSFFEHNGGNPYRIASYFRLLGCRGLIPMPITKAREKLNTIMLHPSWPAKESIFRIEHHVIIKLSAPSYQQKLALQTN